MRFWVVVGYASALIGCGGSVKQDRGAPAAGGGSALGGGGTIGGASGGTNGGSGAANSSYQGGSVLITEEQRAEIASNACVGLSVEYEPLTPGLAFVLAADDRMTLPAEGYNETRWGVLKNAVTRSFDTWGAFTQLGLIAYPNLGAQGATPSIAPQSLEACVNVSAIVPVGDLGAPGSTQRALLASALDATSLGPGRPLADAHWRALAELESSFGVPFVVLFVAGPPTLALDCTNPSGELQPVDGSPLVEQIALALDTNRARTFVVGLPGSESIRSLLSSAAVAGGTAGACDPSGTCHLDLSVTQNLASDLDTALGRIWSEVDAFLAPTFSCTFEIPPPPGDVKLDIDEISVIIASSSETRLILRDDVGECDEGFRLKSEREIELCPASCERQRDGQLAIYFGCGDPIID